MNITAPKVGDTIRHAYVTAEVLDVETIPPHETVNPDQPRWAMTVRIIDGDQNFRPGTESYWPGMGPGDFEQVPS